MEDKNKSFRERIRGDEWNMALLLLLYTLQGIPIGLDACVPMIVAEKGANFRDQTLFGLTSLPFSLKIFWAPLVDSFFVNSFGRRKTWLVPCQFAIGFMLLYLSATVDTLLESKTPDLLTLTQLFFCLYFLTATQDIAVDGWSLTILKPENVTFGPTLNSVGQTLGFFISFTILLALSSVEVCNAYLRTTPLDYPITTFSSFLCFWGIIFLLTTTIVLLFKREPPCTETLHVTSGYVELWQLVQQPQMQGLCILLMTHKLGFMIVESCVGLKLIEYGANKEKLALIGSFLSPVGIFLPLWVNEWCRQRGVVKSITSIVSMRTFMAVIILVIMYVLSQNHSIIQSSYFSHAFFAVSLVSTILSTTGFSAQMIFFSLIADPNFGGTHMTLLNTITNLGSKIGSSLGMLSVDFFTRKECSLNTIGDCGTMDTYQLCMDAGGECNTLQDGFFPASLGWIAFGVAWVYLAGPRLQRLGHAMQAEVKKSKTT